MPPTEMQITQDKLNEFIDGEMEILNAAKKHLRRGPIKSIKLENGRVKVCFSWLAQRDNQSNARKGPWTVIEQLTHEMLLSEYTVYIEKEHENSPFFWSDSLQETALLFPKDGKHLDTSCVKGLNAA